MAPPSRSRLAALAVFALANLLQGTVWSLPGVLAQAHLDAYDGLSANDVQMMVNLGSIVFLAGGVAAAALLDAGYLRVGTQVSAAAIAVGAALRLLAPGGAGADSAGVGGPQLPRALLLLSAALNGLGGLVLMGGVSAIVGAWCEPGERATATAVLVSANNFGLDAAYLLAATGAVPDSVSAGAPQALVRERMLLLNVALAACAAAVAALSLAPGCFPPRPVAPPSRSAALQASLSARFTLAAFAESSRALCAAKGVMLLIVANGAVVGVLSSWQAVLSLVVAPLGIDAVAAGWLGFASSFAGNVAGVAAGLLVDRLRGRHKQAVLACFAVAAAAFAAFAALATGNGAAGGAGVGFAALCATSAVGVVALCAAAPIVIELCVSAAFPVPEGSTLMLLSLASNAAPVPLLLAPAAGGSGGSAMSWGLAATVAAAAAAIALVDLPAKRLAFDDGDGPCGDEAEGPLLSTADCDKGELNH